MVDTMAADDLAPVVMVLTYFFQNILASLIVDCCGPFY